MNQTENIYRHVAHRLALDVNNVKRTLQLLEDGATVPFIARYRKEATGLLDEVAIGSIRDAYETQIEFVKRRQAITDSLRKRELLDASLENKLGDAQSLNQLEDIYLPYRPKRRTRGTIARERGLEPLAMQLLTQTNEPLNPERYISPKKSVFTGKDALAGARDILAERFNEDQLIRDELRNVFRKKATVKSHVVLKKREQAAKFKDYFDWQEPVAKMPGHRLLALFRGETEKMLHVSFRPDEEEAIQLLITRIVKHSAYRQEIIQAITDCYKRLLAPSLENELRKELKDKADKEAIKIFAENLRELLLAPPLGQKRILALDPGFRTGAKLVCLDSQGQLQYTTTIYPTHGEKQQATAAKVVSDLVKHYSIEAIAIGNGTASRETETFIRKLDLGNDLLITTVNEDGASIYSASESARTEFPNQDITVRGAISIGRRLQDPLSELVKIDPKSIGVGQYQHDVNQTELKKCLEDVVINCVNSVGVELNTASVALLSYVSGLGPSLAANIVSWREEHGTFANRKELLKVPRLGAKAYEQAAGFLRLGNSSNPLDASGVHPESYAIVAQMAEDSLVTIKELMRSELARKRIQSDRYISDNVGLPTLEYILTELSRPGRDPRKTFSSVAFADHVHSFDDLESGMVLPAIITNVTSFGAFA
ncbi:MAG: RNA-binding transcriptional accessory protein, partial [Deltaproteobacteria bacterium]|nr:RNA-binding transcriptional accessory protein [Deltaproteobacteria bacterium]